MFLLDYAKNASVHSKWVQQRYLHNCQLTKAGADNEDTHNAFRNGWLRKRKLWVAGKEISLSY